MRSKSDQVYVGLNSGGQKSSEKRSSGLKSVGKEPWAKIVQVKV